MVDDSVRLGINAGPAEAGARRFTAALGTIRAGVQRLGRQSAGAFSAMSTSIGRGTASFSQFKSAQQGLNFNSTNRSVVGLAGGFRGLENSMSGTFQAATVLRVALGALTLGTLVREVFQAGVQLERFVITMEAATGSVRGAGEALRFTQDLALNLGQELGSVQQQFSQFAVASDIAGLSASQTQGIFKSVATAMTVMGRSAQDSQLAFLALQQMVSKGTVMSEELRRQLGERMPGAVQLMAEAVGVSTAELGKMMKRGEVLSKEVLPAFARVVEKRFGPLLEDAFERADVQVRRLTTSITMAQQQIGQAGFMDALADSASRLTEILQSPEFLSIADRLGLGLADATQMAADAVIFLAENFEEFLRLGKLIIGLGLAATFIRVSQAMNMMAQGAVLNLVGGLANSVKFMQLIAGGGGLADSMIKAFLGANAAARAAAAGVTTFRLALSAIAGPVGLVLAALTAGAWVFWPDNANEGAEATERWDRVLRNFAGTADQAKDALARLNDQQLDIRINQAAEAVEVAEENFRNSSLALSELEQRMQSAGSGAMPLVGQQIEGIVARAFAAQAAFRRNEITFNTFKNTLNALADDTPRFAGTLADTIRVMISLTKSTDEAEAAYKRLLEGEKNLGRENMQRLADEADAFNAANIEQVTAAMTNLADLLNQAGGNMAEMQQEIERNKLSGLALELAKVNDEFGGVRDNLERTIESLEARQRVGMLGSDEIEKLVEARGELAKYNELIEALARSRAAEDHAKALEKLRDRAQDLVDELFPVEAAVREQAAGFKLLDEAVKLNIISSEQLAEARKRLTISLEDTLDPVSANIRELKEENVVLKRAKNIMDDYAGINGETALAISELAGANEDLTDKQIRQTAETIKQNEELKKLLETADATGFDAFIESVGTLKEGLEDLKQTIAEELTDALAEFATTGKLSIADLADTILRELNRVLASQVVAGFLEMFGLAGGGGGTGPTGTGRLTAGGAAGDFLAPIMDGVSGAIDSVVSSFSAPSASTSFLDSIDPGSIMGGGTGGGFLDSIGSFFSAFSFGGGGISDQGTGRAKMAPASAFAGAPHFRLGGLTSDDIPAILHPNEAVVPLSGNRAIPVDIRGGGQNGPSTTISNTFMFPPGTDVDKFKRSRGQIEADVNTSLNRAARRNR